MTLLWGVSHLEKPRVDVIARQLVALCAFVCIFGLVLSLMTRDRGINVCTCDVLRVRGSEQPRDPHNCEDWLGRYLSPDSVHHGQHSRMRVFALSTLEEVILAREGNFTIIDSCLSRTASFPRPHNYRSTPTCRVNTTSLEAYHPREAKHISFVGIPNEWGPLNLQSISTTYSLPNRQARLAIMVRRDCRYCMLY